MRLIEQCSSFFQIGISHTPHLDDFPCVFFHVAGKVESGFSHCRNIVSRIVSFVCVEHLNSLSKTHGVHIGTPLARNTASNVQ